MDCAKSLELLSDYQAGTLDESNRDGVNTHLSLCTTCHGVFTDLDAIIQAATALREANGVSFPDEEVLWQRLVIGRKITIH